MNQAQQFRVWLMIAVLGALLQVLAFNEPPVHGFGTVIDSTGVHLDVPVTVPNFWFPLTFALGIMCLLAGSGMVLQFYLHTRKHNQIVKAEIFGEEPK
jgi:hypothetical protein